MQDNPQLVPISIPSIIHEVYLDIPELEMHRSMALLVTEMEKNERKKGKS